MRIGAGRGNPSGFADSAGTLASVPSKRTQDGGSSFVKMARTLGKPSVALPVLSSGQARCLQLAAQGLLQPARRQAKRADVVSAIERMRLLQIDTIHVVARSPYLVLHARLGDYSPEWLEQALEHGRLAECWAHEACFVPASDVGLHRAWRTQRGGHWAHRHALRMRQAHGEQMEALLQHVREQGPVRAADFQREDSGVSGWWEWKPEKRWLEAWFASGELMVTRRERFQRVYDLAERVLARLDPPLRAADEALSPDALRRRFVLDSVRALGVTKARWIADYYRLKPAVTDAELQPLVASGELLAVEVATWRELAYVHADHVGLLDRAAAGRLRATHVALLSPFDPLVWDRARLQAMFDFDYRIECYLPAAKRRWGYYVLPILRRGQLVGRLDAKAHRADGVFEVKALYLEEGVPPQPRMADDLATAIIRSARWHGTPQVRLGRCRPMAFASLLRAALRAQGDTA